MTTVDPPARLDLSMRDNDDKLVALMWRAIDGVTPIPISEARMTLRMDVIEDEPEVVHTISSTTVGDPSGWIEAEELANGRVLVHVPFGLWSDITARTGIYDVIAVSTVQTFRRGPAIAGRAAAPGAVTRCLARGEFVVERGVST